MTTLFGFITNNLIAPLIGFGERLKDADENQKRNNDNVSASIRCCIPAQVVSYNPVNQTIVAQPVLQEKIVNRVTGNTYWQTTAPLVDVPVCWQQGGGFCSTFPLAPGDEVLIMFADSSIDCWWQSGGIQKWLSRRRHDLSDGFAIPGVRSVPNAIPNVATDAAEFRSLDGNLLVSLKQDAGVNSLTIKSDGGTALFKKQTLISNAIPFDWDNIKLSVGAANLQVGVTNTVVTIGGVPTDVPTPTVSINGKFEINGVSFP